MSMNLNSTIYEAEGLQWNPQSYESMKMFFIEKLKALENQWFNSISQILQH